MPTLTEEQIREKIISGEINGISIDTSIFDRYKCNLEFPLLRKLDQFKSEPTKVVFSEIVASEVKRHISRDAADAAAKLKTALKNQLKKWHLPFDITEILNKTTNSLDSLEIATNQFEHYLKHVDGNIIPAANDIKITSEVLNRYFSSTTPFENKGAKKNEFPDAFALLSLEAEFSDQEKMVLCVSADKGWAEFAKNSNSIICVSELENALSYFNDIEDETAEKIIQLLKDGNAQELLDEISQTIERQLENNDFIPDCQNGLDYDAEPYSAVIQNILLDSISQLIVVEANENDITFTFSVDVEVIFEAEFSFHAYDSIDKDYVHLSSEYASIDKTLPYKIIVTIDRDLNPEPSASNTAVSKNHLNIDFGYVEPFPNEDPNHERY
ncbi:MAG: DUF4935 domain-containing protein [Rhizobiales bacterium]|nr:DUF4935 domain-containing protein [Hyphomicrobiales bacterium]